MTEEHEIQKGKSYVVGDAVSVLAEYENEAAAIFLDDAWARPSRAEQFGVEYETHPFDETVEAEPRSVGTTDITTTEIIDACKSALKDGGWLIADADDWLLPRLIDYLREDWGDVAAKYTGGGYRKIGGVTYLSKDKTPDRSTAGMYLSTGGYPVVFAHKGETDKQTSESARQVVQRNRESYGWGSVKPISPYEKWVNGLVEEGEQIIVPCAGTAPAALAAERVYGANARYVCIDIEEGAFEAFKRRREAELDIDEQAQLDQIED